MNTETNIIFSEYRNASFLKLKDVAFLLDIDQANLSRFEKGKSNNPKALIGYQVLFDISKSNTTQSLFILNYEIVRHRCFQLIEKLKDKGKLHVDSKRIDGIHKIITRLTAHVD